MASSPRARKLVLLDLALYAIVGVLALLLLAIGCSLAVGYLGGAGWAA